MRKVPSRKTLALASAALVVAGGGGAAIAAAQGDAPSPSSFLDAVASAGGFADRRLRLGHLAEHERHVGGVEVLIVKRQRARIALHELGFESRSLKAAPGRVEHLALEVESDSSPAAGRDCPCGVLQPGPRPWPDLEHQVLTS